MYKPKEAIRAQLDVAGRDIADLETSIAAYVLSSCRIVRDDDLGLGKATYRLKGVVQPPIAFAVEILKIGSLLRPPLDQMATNLVENSGIVPATKNPYFPICVQEANWGSEAGKMKGMSDQDRDAILALQPFEQNRGLNLDHHPLALLQTLTNLPKHRLLLSVQTAASQVGTYAMSSAFSIQGCEFLTVEFKEDAIVAWVIPTRDQRLAGYGASGSGGSGAMGSFFTQKPIQDMTPDEIRALVDPTKPSGPWDQEAWKTCFRDLNFELKLTHEIYFGPGTERLEGHPVIPALKYILKYLNECVFREGGLIERLV